MKSPRPGGHPSTHDHLEQHIHAMSPAGDIA